MLPIFLFFKYMFIIYSLVYMFVQAVLEMIDVLACIYSVFTRLEVLMSIREF